MTMGLRVHQIIEEGGLKIKAAQRKAKSDKLLETVYSSLMDSFKKHRVEREKRAVTCGSLEDIPIAPPEKLKAKGKEKLSNEVKLRPIYEIDLAKKEPPVYEIEVKEKLRLLELRLAKLAKGDILQGHL